MDAKFNTFKKKKALEFDSLVQRYRNKHKELEQIYNQKLSLVKSKTSPLNSSASKVNF
jgi:hypothetical protein